MRTPEPRVSDPGADPASGILTPALRIGIDVSRAVGDRTGIGVYVAELVEALARIDARHRYTLFPSFWGCFPDGTEEYQPPGQANFSLHRDPHPDTRRAAAWHSPFACADALVGELDLLHGTHLSAPRLERARLVVTVQDASCLVVPEHHTRANVRLTIRETRRALSRAVRILVPSDATRRDLADRMGADPGKIRVVPLAARAIFRPVVDPVRIRRTLERLGIDRNYVLYAGALEPRKNLPALIEAFARDAARDGDGHLLVLAGPRGWMTEPIDKALARLPAARVRLTGYVTDAELAALYTACRAFVYPSFYEGFGLPPLEAMACGAPVIASNTSSLPEVTGDAALPVDPRDIDGLTAAIARVLEDSEFRASLRARGLARSRLFSWDETARKTLAVYEEAARS